MTSLAVFNVGHTRTSLTILLTAGLLIGLLIMYIIAYHIDTPFFVTEIVSETQPIYHPPWYDDIKNMPNPFTDNQECKKDFNYPNLAEALSTNASPDKVIILPSTVDLGYQEMALNYYEFNLHRLHITNFLFMCINKAACDVLKKYCIPAFLFTEVPNSDRAFIYHDQRFVQKATVKLSIASEALKLGYNILLTDLDILFLKHHLPCGDCDVQIQINQPKIVHGHHEFNSGFYYVRNGPSAIEAFAKTVQISKDDPRQHDQEILNKVLLHYLRQGKLKVNVLSRKAWPAGLDYFGQEGHEKRDFFDSKPPDDVVVIHNNWMLGTVVKIYRMKEHLMWVSDYNRYYSDAHRKYLIYDNPGRLDGQWSRSTEKLALYSALGISQLLNRTMILPRFHCGYDKIECPASKFLDIKWLDENYEDIYRESSFLLNPRTPDDLSSSPSLFIQSTQAANIGLFNKNVTEVLEFVPADINQGASCQELEQWFKPFSDVRILRFHSLYGALHKLKLDFETHHLNCL